MVFASGIVNRLREFAVTGTPRLSLVIGAAVNCENAAANFLGTVESAVALEIEAMGGHRRPGLAVCCLALAQVLENPRAIRAAGRRGETHADFEHPPQEHFRR